MTEKERKPHELKIAKLQLYHLIITTPYDEITDSEAELAYRLCLDTDIQDVFQNARDKEKGGRQ